MANYPSTQILEHEIPLGSFNMYGENALGHRLQSPEKLEKAQKGLLIEVSKKDRSFGVFHPERSRMYMRERDDYRNVAVQYFQS